MDKNKLKFYLAEPDIGSLEIEYVTQAVQSGWVSSMGEFINRFEQGIAEICGVKHGIAVSNGTVALHLALVASGIGPGDEVIVPSLTFVATAAAVLHAGATPVFVDSEPDTYNMDPEVVSKAISQKTKAIIPVHLYGHPVDMEPILKLASNHNCIVIEDAAEAHGALYHNKKVGSLGNAGTFSFYGNKLLTTGEGGAIVTNDEALAERMRFLKDHAMDSHRRYWHPDVGFNYRMTNLQAALGCAQVERFDEIMARRQALINMYRETFSDLSLIINPDKEWAKPAPWLTTLLLPPGYRADTLAEKLRRTGIDSRPFFVPLNNMPPYRKFKTLNLTGENGCPVSDDLYMRGIILPTIPSDRNEFMIKHIHYILSEYLKE